MSWHSEAERFLTWLNAEWELTLDNPERVPGNTWDEKVLHLVAPYVPTGVEIYVGSRFDLTYGRRFRLFIQPAGAPPPPMDFDIRLA